MMMTEDGRERRYWQWWVMRSDLPQNHVCALVVLLVWADLCVCVCVCERERERERETPGKLCTSSSSSSSSLLLTSLRPSIINSHQVESFFFEPLGTFFVWWVGCVFTVNSALDYYYKTLSFSRVCFLWFAWIEMLVVVVSILGFDQHVCLLPPQLAFVACQ